MDNLLYQYMVTHVSLAQKFCRMPTELEIANDMKVALIMVTGIREKLEKMDIHDIEKFYFEGSKKG